MQYIFIGSVIPESTRISSPKVKVSLPAGPDYPALRLRTQILDNRVISVCDVEDALHEIGCLTVRNIVRDVASSICDSVALLQGAWTVVTVDTCVGPDGAVRMRFSNSLPRLKKEFAQQQVQPQDIMLINSHPQGFHLRLALDDLNSGIMEMKFLRTHCYKAVEALKNSVCAGVSMSKDQQWRYFREAIGVQRDTLERLVHQEERHGDYAGARPLSGADVGAVLHAIAHVISAYIAWFKRDKLSSSAGPV